MSFNKPQAHTYGKDFARNAIIDEGNRLIPLMSDRAAALFSTNWPNGLEGVKDFDELCGVVSLIWRSVDD